MRHDVGALQDPRQCKVGNHCYITAAIEKHIPRLAVKPDNAPIVEVEQAASNAQCNQAALLIPAGLPWRGFIIADSPSRVAALHKFGHQKRLSSKNLLRKPR